MMKFTWSNLRKVTATKTVGRLLVVDLPALGIEGLKAKVDTGAFSGALHATNIREVSVAKGEKSLTFTPFGSLDHVIEFEGYHKRSVKSSNGSISVRYAIDTDIEIDGQRYPITLTLTDRSKMKYPMLVGRNFLRIHGFLVDVGQNSK